MPRVSIQANLLVLVVCLANHCGIWFSIPQPVCGRHVVVVAVDCYGAWYKTLHDTFTLTLLLSSVKSPQILQGHYVTVSLWGWCSSCWPNVLGPGGDLFFRSCWTWGLTECPPVVLGDLTTSLVRLSRLGSPPGPAGVSALAGLKFVPCSWVALAGKTF